MTVDRGPWITTIRGEPFYLKNPFASEIEPDAISWALAHLCRFTGHVKSFYSVAQHCVIVSNNVPQEYAMEGLLHDAAEAFTGDINRPLKGILNGVIGLLAQVEGEIERAISNRFEVPWPWHPSVKEADNRAFATEIRDVAPSSHRYPHEMVVPYPEKIYPWGPVTARREWMNRFVELGGK